MRCILALITIIMCISLNSQITVTENDREYSLKYDIDSASYRVLRFSKEFEDSLFTYLNYSRSKKADGFEKEVMILDTLFGKSVGKIALDLRSASIGYPLEFDDIMPKYIKTFIDSRQWSDHIKVKGRELDYKLMRKVILEGGAFESFLSLLKKYGYEVKEISTEKHGFVLKEDLIKYGFQGDEIIPVPFMLYWKLKKIKLLNTE